MMTEGIATMTRFGILLALGMILASTALWAADGIELLSGAKLQGEIVEKDATHVTISAAVGGQTVTRKFPLDRVHAITTAGQREVLHEMEAGAKPSPAKTAAGKGAAGTQRTKAEVEALIQEVGGAKPDWWDSTPLEYPKTLDLTFPEPAPGGWNAQRNVGQYLWEIIHPNPGKWKQGIRFIHYLLEVNKEDPAKCQRMMNTLGGMYFRLLGDYPRAAYWWRKAGVEKGDRFWSGVDLAECYWRMGNKAMALDLIGRIDPQFGMIKLMADMGETDQALKWAEAWARGSGADIAYLYAGDACRVAGRHREALAYYQKVLRIPAEGRPKGRIERNHRRAQANIDGIKVFELLDLARVPDGTHRSSSMGYEAPVQVAVTVKAGRIEEVKVTEHHEKQYYSSINDTCRKIIAKQGVTGIDATSSATITSEAIINATAKALAEATK
jgi:uncharacterized protein with FMN-binding domain